MWSVDGSGMSASFFEHEASLRFSRSNNGGAGKIEHCPAIFMDSHGDDAG